jgi:photosystem II stability/assembly factor-like uncharacterized protein
MQKQSVAWCVAALIALPLAVNAQEKRSCWLRDANSPAASTAYLLCEQGQIWTTADAGKTWSARTTGATVKLRAFAWIDAQRGVAIGDTGTLLATTDGGKTWQPRESGVKDHLMDITFVGQQGWVAGYRGAVLHTADGGKTWTKQTTKTTMTLESIFFLDADHGWTVGWSGTILRTTDGGKTWNQIKSDAAQWTLSAVLFKDANNGWASGFSGTLLRTKDGGATWTALPSPVKGTLSAIGFDTSNRGWITYDDGFLLSNDGGETWKQQSAAGRYFLGKLVPVDKALWAVGQQVVLQQSGDGTAWKKIDSFVANSSMNDLLGPKTK